MCKFKNLENSIKYSLICLNKMVQSLKNSSLSFGNKWFFLPFVTPTIIQFHLLSVIIGVNDNERLPAFEHWPHLFEKYVTEPAAILFNKCVGQGGLHFYLSSPLCQGHRDTLRLFFFCAKGNPPSVSQQGLGTQDSSSNFGLKCPGRSKEAWSQ